MNHNKFNLQVGTLVVLDKGRCTESIVFLDHLTPSAMFATVHSRHCNVEDNWEVMTCRLSPITENQLIDDNVEERSCESKPLLKFISIEYPNGSHIVIND